MVPEKSSIGEISSKISCSPDLGLTSSPASARFWTSASQRSLPTSQSKLLVWSERSFGTSRGSEIFAKEIRRGALLMLTVVLGREAAKRRPSRGWLGAGTEAYRRCDGQKCHDRGEGRRNERD